MIKAAVLTIGDEILIGQITDTNSGTISRELSKVGAVVLKTVSVRDNVDAICSELSELLRTYDLVLSTGGLGPTKDDMTKTALQIVSGSSSLVRSREQQEINEAILKSRGLDVLQANMAQSLVPDKCEVIPNRIGTAPIMVFDFDSNAFGHKAVLYSMPGVPFEVGSALGDISKDIEKRFGASSEIVHRNFMTFGLAESALSEKIKDWEEALPGSIKLAYLPNPITGVKLRLSLYGGSKDDIKALERHCDALKDILGDYIYASSESSLQAEIGALLRGSGKTLAAAESCTGGKISNLLTLVGGASEYYLGSVTSYSPEVKKRILGVEASSIKQCGIVSSEVAIQMACGVRRVLQSTYSVATTGWADRYGDEHEPAGTVWIGIDGPLGPRSKRFNCKSDREHNIERFAASALNELRKYIAEDQMSSPHS